MELVTPGIGLLFWMLLSFSIVFFILKKFAWEPILKSLKEREQSISDQLEASQLAREEMTQMKADQEKVIEQARFERDRLMKEARDIKEQIIAESRIKAEAEAKKIIEQAINDIENQKKTAMTEIKNLVASTAVEIAEKVLRRELQSPEEQKKFIDSLIKEIPLN